MRRFIPKILIFKKNKKIYKWITVNDTTIYSYYHSILSHKQIIEVDCTSSLDGVVGNSQRNYGLSFVEDDNYTDFLDDNITYPNFWEIINELEQDTIHTFNQYRDKNENILLGNRIEINYIDTAMYIIHKNMIGNIKWQEDLQLILNLYLIYIEQVNTSISILTNNIVIIIIQKKINRKN